MFDPLDRREAVEADVVQPPREAGKRAGLVLDGRPAQILEQIVVGVHAVKRRVRRVSLVKVRKIPLHEMNQRLR